MESTLFRVLGDNMFVVDHDYDGGGKKDHILFVPRDIETQAYDAACMYAGEDEETRTIQFGCDPIQVMLDCLMLMVMVLIFQLHISVESVRTLMLSLMTRYKLYA